MGFSYYEHNGRDMGYDVPSKCDHPDCTADIERGIEALCGGDPDGGKYGCGRVFCCTHLEFVSFLPEFEDMEDEEVDELLGRDESTRICERCFNKRKPFNPKPDVKEWIDHKLTDSSWKQWRLENPAKVAEYKKQLKEF